MLWLFHQLRIANMAVGGGFFDQYSVFCVFGSVVGCVVVPLITQSVESVIFSAIVISLTATHLTKRATKSENSNQVNTKDVFEKRPSRKLKDRDREQTSQVKKRKQMSQQVQAIIVKIPEGRKQKEDNQKRLDLARQLELERKQEEKKERKFKKKEERLKRKEQEREEKEKEEHRLKVYKEQRQREMRENVRQADKGTLLQRVDSTKARLSGTSKITRKVDSSAPTPPKSSVKVPGSPLLTTQYLSRQRSQSEGSESEPPSPPPSVWKVPEYVEPKWNPGKPESKTGSLKETRLNNDVVCAKVKLQPPFNQLYNPVYNSQAFKKNQFMNQNPEKSQTVCECKPSLQPAEFTKIKDMDKPDNRHVKFTSYSSFSGLDLLSQLKEDSKTPDSGVRSYSLFGPDEPNSTIFRSPLTGH